MIDHLPAYLRGLMIAGFLSAYMSTMGTHLNLGASYLTNDVYRRFMRPGASEEHYVAISRIATVIVMVLAIVGAYGNNSVGGAYIYLYNLTAGVGLVMILRWYWWRVNAWSEISALVASAVVSNALIVARVFRDPNANAEILLVTVPVTTAVWFAVTFLTAPEPEATLVRFYERVRPSSLGWRAIARIARHEPGVEPLGINAIDWVAGCGLVYGALFGIGKLVLGNALEGALYLALATVCGATIAYNVTRAERASHELPAEVTAS
jgi:Na+/proline symporter